MDTKDSKGGQRKAPSRKTPTGKKAAPTKKPSAPSQKPKATQPAAKKRASGAAQTRKAATQTARKRTAAATKRKVRRPTPDVIYTPPKPYSRSKLLLQLATTVAVVLALTFGISIFFKVENVMVAGHSKYQAWTIKEAAGIQVGENLLTLSNAKISGKIRAELPYVDTVRVGIRLPDTVHIEVTELSVFYSVKDEGGNWWLVSCEGRVLERVNAARAEECTKILGVILDNPDAGKQAEAWEPKADEEGEETIPVTTGKDRLMAALSIAGYLEKHHIVGEMASMDVTDMGAIELWYGTRFQISLGDSTQLDYKVETMKAAMDQLMKKDYESGSLDLSKVANGVNPTYKPFV